MLKIRAIEALLLAAGPVAAMALFGIAAGILLNPTFAASAVDFTRNEGQIVFLSVGMAAFAGWLWFTPPGLRWKAVVLVGLLLISTHMINPENVFPDPQPMSDVMGSAMLAVFSIGFGALFSLVGLFAVYVYVSERRSEASSDYDGVWPGRR